MSSVSVRVPSGTEPVPKILKSGYRYRIYPVRYGSVPVWYQYLRAKTGKYRYRTGTKPVPKMVKVGTESVPKKYLVR
ncbi:hypothetical protein Hanom_Chr07g00633881 [Helianthus anomalus]